MHSLRLNVNEKVYDKLLRLLSKFSKDKRNPIESVQIQKINLLRA